MEKIEKTERITLNIIVTFHVLISCIWWVKRSREKKEWKRLSTFSQHFFYGKPSVKLGSGWQHSQSLAKGWRVYQLVHCLPIKKIEGFMFLAFDVVFLIKLKSERKNNSTHFYCASYVLQVYVSNNILSTFLRYSISFNILSRLQLKKYLIIIFQDQLSQNIIYAT